MNPKTFVNRFILLSLVIGTILAAYIAAKAQTTGNPKLGAQIVDQRNARGLIACGALSSDASSDFLREFTPDVTRLFRKHAREENKKIQEKLAISENDNPKTLVLRS